MRYREIELCEFVDIFRFWRYFEGNKIDATEPQ